MAKSDPLQSYHGSVGRFKKQSFTWAAQGCDGLAKSRVSRLLGTHRQPCEAYVADLRAFRLGVNATQHSVRIGA